jgi:uncharacterized membrane protein YcaP (DUF421 family)
MDAVIRVACMYAFLLLVFRLAGKRTLGESTPFDLLLLLVISEATQQALVGEDKSFTHALILILTFVTIDIGLSLWKQRSKRSEKILEGVPLIVVANGQPLKDRMDKARVNEDDVMEAARLVHGLERLEQVKFAILERNGRISIIPR